MKSPRQMRVLFGYVLFCWALCSVFGLGVIQLFAIDEQTGFAVGLFSGLVGPALGVALFYDRYIRNLRYWW
jgi:hypothetical protein